MRARRNGRLVRGVVMAVAGAGMALVVARAMQTGASPSPSSDADLLKRGEYLVTIGGCNDCHTPWKMGERGPEPDMTRMLSGHPEAVEMPPAPQGDLGPWMGSTAATNTAFAGPWGVSYSANLTPDETTGIGTWTEEWFIASLRTGKHWGRGRDIHPPMPWPWYSKMTDEDLKAIFAYLKTIPPIENAVPAWTPPAGAGEGEPAPGGN